MSKEQIKIRKYIYRDRNGIFENKTTISELSIRHGKMHLDRRNARYLVEENIKENANYDLKLGCREYFEESDSEDESEGEVVDGVDGVDGEEETEPIASVFCSWACLQPYQSPKEAFGGADFVSYRSLLRDIAKTIITHRRFRPNEGKPKPIYCRTLDEVVFQSTYRNPRTKPWSRIAMKAGDVILIRDDDECPFLDLSDDEEDEEEDEENEDEEEEENETEMSEGDRIVACLNEMQRNEKRQQKYSGFKFQQYMTAEDPESAATPEKRLKARTFYTVMTGDLIERDEKPIRVCCFADCDALRGDEPIELKSTFSEGYFSKVHTFLHCNFANMETLVTGERNKEYITTRVFERKVSQLLNDFTSEYEGDSRPDEQCYSFLYDVLAMTKHILTRAKACRFVYMPKSGIIQFEPITLKEAKKRGHAIPEEFKARFNISDC